MFPKKNPTGEGNNLRIRIIFSYRWHVFAQFFSSIMYSISNHTILFSVAKIIITTLFNHILREISDLLTTTIYNL